MAIKIYSYTTGSESAHLLAEAMDVWLLKHNGSRYVPRVGDTVINWGSGRDWTPARTLNHPDRTAVAINKLRFFQRMDPQNFEGAARVPEWTTRKEVAQQWTRDGFTVVARTQLTEKEGRGIVISTTPNEVPNAPLYTKYIPKQGEYRVHIVGGEVIDQQRKVLGGQVERDRANWYVRNTANGFIFQREGIQVPEDVRVQAKAAVKVLGLDFGAVDVIWNEHRKRAYVLEVNTAPGIVGTTVINYANALRTLINKGR